MAGDDADGTNATAGRKGFLIVVGLFAVAVAIIVVGVALYTDSNGAESGGATTIPSSRSPSSESVDEPPSSSSTTGTRLSPLAAGSIIFGMSRGGTSQVFIRDLASGAQHEVAGELVNPVQPTSDADGARIAVVADDGAGIYLRRSRDDSFIRLPLPARSHSPALSPDGLQMAFVSEVSGQEDIYIVDIATLSVRAVADSSSDEFDPAWAPTGDYLAFVRHGSVSDDVVVVTPDGAVVSVVDSPGAKWSPAISAIPIDGASLVSFVGSVEGQRDPQLATLASGVVVATHATPGTDLGLTWCGNGSLVVSSVDSGLLMISPDGEQSELGQTQGASDPQWFGPVA